MNIYPGTLFQRLLWIVILLPVAAFGDQTDTRLDELFATLQSDDNIVVQHVTVQSIWKIWYESDREEINQLMQEGGEAVLSGELEKAERIFTQIVEISPEFSEGWNRRATVRYNRRDYAGSLDDIKQTLALEPRHFGAIWGKGMILGQQGDFAGAIQAFQQMLQIAPYSEDAKRRIELLEREIRKSSA